MRPPAARSRRNPTARRAARVLAAAGAVLTLGAVAAADPVHVALDWPHGRGKGAGPVRVCATRVPPAEGPAACRLTDGTEARLELDPGAWSLHAAADGFWSAGAALTVGPAPGPAAGTRLTLWPASSLAGALAPPDGGSAPEAVEVLFTSSAQADPRLPPVSGLARCPVLGGRWRCVVPAGRLDLEVRPAGAVPHYAWDVVLSAGGEASLGTLPVQRAASVAGWVARPENAPSGGSCRAEVRNPAPGPASSRPPAAAIDTRGFFQIVGVRPGTPDLVIDCPPLAKVTRTLTVLPDAETRLPRLLVPLEVIVIPPLDPRGRPWKVDVFRFQERTELAVLEPASEQGRWFRHRVAAVPHEVNVASDADVYWLHQVVEAKELAGPLTLRVPMRRVAGTVVAGTEPVRGRLTFADEASMLAGRVPVERMPRITVESRDDGSFESVLPAPALTEAEGWNIEVHATRPPVNHTLERVQPAELRPDGVAWFELALPAASVRGTVVSAGGRPEPRVGVRAESLASRWEYHDTTTDEGGIFQFVALPAGGYRVSVEGSSEPQDVEVLEGVAHELHFVNKPMRRFRGRILGHGRPLAAAWVHVWRAPGVQQASYITGSDGLFEVDVPGDAAELGVTVRAAGYAFKMARVPYPGPDVVPITVEEGTGSLLLALPPEPPDESRGLAVLAHNQSLEAIENVKAWATANRGGEDGDRVVVPGVEPGDYTLCRIPPRESPALWNGRFPREYCSRTERLDAGGTVTLTLPSPAAR
jgi:hypothetical protein